MASSVFAPTRNFGYGPDITMVVAAQFATAAPKEVAIADFNGDGKLDALITTVQVPNSTAVPVRLMLGDGAGGFTDGTTAVLGASPPVVMFARQILTADFNGDGRPDVYVSDHGSDAPPWPGFQNTLILSSGATGFVNATATLPQVSDFSHSATFADIDGDGDLDIFVANLGGSSPYFLINDGHGGFTKDATRIPASSFATGVSPSTVLLFDANGDGRPDLMLGDVQGTSGSTILRNDGTGHFNTVLTMVPDLGGSAPADAYDIHAVDLNGDGRLDLIVLYDVNIDTAGRLQVLINRPDGTFVDETASRIAEPANSATALRVQVVDLNGDGLPDLYINQNSDRPVYLNDGAGHFVRMPAGFVPGNSGDNSTVADVNGDGRMDLVAVHNATTLSVRLGLDPGLVQTGTAGDDGFMGDADSETISGGGGNDVIFGGGGANILKGDAGNDYIVSQGADTLTGGTGADVFVIDKTSSRVVITDFSHAEGDTIDLSAYGLTTLPALQAALYQSGSDAVITLGSGSLTLSNVSALTASDFGIAGSGSLTLAPYTTVLRGAAGQYAVSVSGSTVTITDSVASRDGVTAIPASQQARFSDYTLVFDLHSSQDLLVYKLYQAAFARTPDNGGFRYWAAAADAHNYSALQLADAFLAAPEFAQKYGANPSDTVYATAMYQNVLQRAPDAAGLAYWVGNLAHGEARDQLLVDFATSAENAALVGVHTSNGYWTT